MPVSARLAVAPYRQPAQPASTARCRAIVRFGTAWIVAFPGGLLAGGSQIPSRTPLLDGLTARWRPTRSAWRERGEASWPSAPSPLAALTPSASREIIGLRCSGLYAEVVLLLLRCWQWLLLAAEVPRPEARTPRHRPTLMRSISRPSPGAARWARSARRSTLSRHAVPKTERRLPESSTRLGRICMTTGSKTRR